MSLKVFWFQFCNFLFYFPFFLVKIWSSFTLRYCVFRCSFTVYPKSFMSSRSNCSFFLFFLVFALFCFVLLRQILLSNTLGPREELRISDAFQELRGVAALRSTCPDWAAFIGSTAEYAAWRLALHNLENVGL